MGENFKALLETRRQLQTCYKDVEGLAGRIKELEARLAPIPPPVYYGEITGSKLRAALVEVFSRAWYHIKLSANLYKVTTVDEVKRFLAQDKTNERQYMAGGFDCDRFADVLHARFKEEGDWCWVPDGVIWDVEVERHAWNIIIAYPSVGELEPRLYFIEPQSDRLWEVAYEQWVEREIELIKI